MKLSLVKAVTPSTMKSSRAAILTSTITLLARAVSRTPTTSTDVMTRTMNTAGMFTTPPSPGGPAIDSGRETPNSVSRRLLRYSPQPTATAATDTPYSRTRSQPMIQATSSPIVTYAYVYALPATGMLEASSA